MTPIGHGNRLPDVPRLLEALNRSGVRYILIGSLAAQLYGIEAQPGDLDITPALDRENLARLASLLLEIEAKLPAIEEIGDWEIQPDGERKWISRTATEQDLLERAAWQPDADDLSTLDHLFQTRHGNLDVVPELTGDYETLVKRAVKMEAHGQEVWVVHVDELLTALTIPRRKKDVSRVRQLREIQRRLNRPRSEESLP
jgi:hypothetical protein